METGGFVAAFAIPVKEFCRAGLILGFRQYLG
jgi:hypothetical protein